MDYDLIFGESGGEYLGTDADELSAELNGILKKKKLSVAAAESFTAGRIASAIIKTPGASAVFKEGIVAYSNESKVKRLGVSEKTLENFGAVSEECCAEMLSGLIKSSGADVAISSTGIAGPKSDDTKKPVGLCFIGIAAENRFYIFKFIFNGDRETITETAVRAALHIAISRLK
ncbi:MAG: CinA family protein [Clostridia bacterium]|nr:CinA family protein [Clostridia bacterium]